MWHAIWSLLFLFIGWNGAGDHAGPPAFIYPFMFFALFLFGFVAVSRKLRPEYKTRCIARCSLEKSSNPLSSKHQPISSAQTNTKLSTQKFISFAKWPRTHCPFCPLVTPVAHRGTRTRSRPSPTGHAPSPTRSGMVVPYRHPPSFSTGKSS